MVFTIFVITFVWMFRRTRGAVVLGLLAGLWLRRVWVTGPTKVGTLGGPGRPPRWVRAASRHVGARRALGSGPHHTGSLFDPKPPKDVAHWW
jgi:hypothetical protein